MSKRRLCCSPRFLVFHVFRFLERKIHLWVLGGLRGLGFVALCSGMVKQAPELWVLGLWRFRGAFLGL